MTVCVKLEFDKQTYDVWLTEILETFQRVFSFRKSRFKENGGDTWKPESDAGIFFFTFAVVSAVIQILILKSSKTVQDLKFELLFAICAISNFLISVIFQCAVFRLAKSYFKSQVEIIKFWRNKNRISFLLFLKVYSFWINCVTFLTDMTLNAIAGHECDSFSRFAE